MTRPYMFLSCVIPGPNNPKNKIDVFLQPLVDELKMLWDEGVHTYDVHANETFKMKAALMWTVNDFLAYGMLSGWSTHGALSCPVCQDQLRGFYLEHGRKMLWFDCHRCFLPRNHVFRRNRKAFTRDRTVNSQPPQRLSPELEWSLVQHFPKVTEDLILKFLGSGKMCTIGRNAVCSGIYLIGNTNYYDITWMLCILRKTSVKIFCIQLWTYQVNRKTM